MAIWNDKRTPPGVYHDTQTGQPVGFGPQVSSFGRSRMPDGPPSSGPTSTRRFGENSPPSAPAPGVRAAAKRAATPPTKPAAATSPDTSWDKRKSQTTGERLATKVFGKPNTSVTTRRGNAQRAAGKLKPLK